LSSAAGRPHTHHTCVTQVLFKAPSAHIQHRYLPLQIAGEEKPGVVGAVSNCWGQDELRPTRPALSEHAIADVCVVGGGLSGLSTALMCAKAGACRLGCNVRDCVLPCRAKCLCWTHSRSAGLAQSQEDSANDESRIPASEIASRTCLRVVHLVKAKCRPGQPTGDVWECVCAARPGSASKPNCCYNVVPIPHKTRIVRRAPRIACRGRWYERPQLRRRPCVGPAWLCHNSGAPRPRRQPQRGTGTGRGPRLGHENREEGEDQLWVQGGPCLPPGWQRGQGG
jgi:hypothetical protein